MKKIVIVSFLLVTTLLQAGYYRKGEKPTDSSSDKPVVVGGGFSFKGEKGEVASENKAKKVEASSNFLHPMDFKNTDEQKQQVINYIKVQTKKSLEMLEMIDSYNNILAREMEQQELNSFKALTQAKDRQVMDNLIKQLKSINSLNYILLKEMYDQEMMASSQELTW